MHYSQKQKEFLESFGFNPNNMTIYQVFVTINWLKKKNPTTELVNKLKAKLEGRNPTKPVGAQREWRRTTINNVLGEQKGEVTHPRLNLEKREADNLSAL